MKDHLFEDEYGWYRVEAPKVLPGQEILPGQIVMQKKTGEF